MKLETKMFTISPYIPFTKPYYIHQCFGKRSHFKDILEIGCGTGRHMSYLRKRLREGFLTVGLDIWPPYLKLSKQNRTHDELILGDACHLPFKEKSFDLVLALDLLEHIPKEKGIKLLNDVEKVARKRVVLSLPIGWHPSHHQGNPYDEHVSAWTVKELRERGYQIYTFYIRGAGGELFENRIPVYLRPFWLIIKTLAGLITSNFSNLAGYMVACKDVKNGQ